MLVFTYVPRPGFPCPFYMPLFSMSVFLRTCFYARISHILVYHTGISHVRVFHACFPRVHVFHICVSLFLFSISWFDFHVRVFRFLITYVLVRVMSPLSVLSVLFRSPKRLTWGMSCVFCEIRLPNLIITKADTNSCNLFRTHSKMIIIFYSKVVFPFSIVPVWLPLGISSHSNNC